MNFSRLLSKFLEARANKEAQFYIGDWLRTLDNQLLGKLARYSTAWKLPEGSKEFYLASEEMAKIISLALAAETNGQAEINDVNAVLRKADKLNDLIGLVMLSRQGLVEFSESLSLSTESSTNATLLHPDSSGYSSGPSKVSLVVALDQAFKRTRH